MNGERQVAPHGGGAIGQSGYPLIESRFVPRRYEPNYAYPLLVLLHGRGGDADSFVHGMMPNLSWRNYIAVGFRGTVPLSRGGRVAGYTWGSAFARPGREGSARGRSRRDNAALFDDSPDDSIDAVEAGVFDGIRDVRRSLHVHSERIFLVGSGEGAAVAYRLGLTYPERFAGVVAINGWMASDFRPLARWKACRNLRVLAVHGVWNTRAPIENARRTVDVLRTAGLPVAFQSYPSAHRASSHMLADVDTWLMHQCTTYR